MANPSGNLLIHIAKTPAGKVVGATNTSPYLLIEADSDEELRSILTRALRFYAAHKNEPTPVTEEPRTVTRFATTEVIDSRELVAA